MTAFTCDALSFSVKYRCPVFQTRQFDSSPSTQTSKNSASSRSRTRTVRSVTESTRRALPAAAPSVRRAGPPWLAVSRSSGGGAGSLSRPSASGISSSNGRSNRSLIRLFRQVLDVVGAQAQALDAGRPSALRIGVDDHPVEPRVRGGGLELRRQRGQELAERRGDVDADDRI